MALQGPTNVWQRVPNEIRVQILKNAPDLPTLRNFLAADPSNHDLFRHYAKDIWPGPLSCLDTETQRDVDSLMHHRIKNAGRADQVAKDLEQCLRSNNWPRLDSYSCDDDVALLFYIVEVIESIDYLTASFAHHRLIIPSGCSDGCISPAEFYRIKRSFWTFYRAFERGGSIQDSATLRHANHVPGRLVSTKRREDADPGNNWLCYQKDPPRMNWQQGRADDETGSIRAFEAIRGFLIDEINSIQLCRRYPSLIPGQKQVLLIERLIRDAEHWPLLAQNIPKNILTVDVSSGLVFGMRIPEFEYDDVTDLDEDEGISISEARLIQEQQDSLLRSEQWGWCIWDRERLVRARMILPLMYREHGSAVSSLWLRSTREGHERCDEMLKSATIQGGRAWFARKVYDRDVADVERERRRRKEEVLRRQKDLQKEELKKRASLLRWVERRDWELFEEWDCLLRGPEFGPEEQMRAKDCWEEVMEMMKENREQVEDRVKRRRLTV